MGPAYVRACLPACLLGALRHQPSRLYLAPNLAFGPVSPLFLVLVFAGRSIQYTLSSMLFNVLPTILEISECRGPYPRHV